MKDESYSWEELGNRIRASRRIRGISQEEVAEALGITVSRLRDFEYGRRVMTVDLLVRLAQVLDVSTDFLTTGRQSGSLFCSWRLRSPSAVRRWPRGVQLRLRRFCGFSRQCPRSPYCGD